jgi:hypothetical protein
VLEFFLQRDFLYIFTKIFQVRILSIRVFAQSTKIYDRSGEHLLYDIHGDEKRTIVPFNQIPDTVEICDDCFGRSGFLFSSRNSTYFHYTIGN